MRFLTCTICCWALLAATVRAEPSLVVVAGQGAPQGAGQGLLDPFAVAFDSAGNMYIAEMTGHRIRRLDREGRLHSVAGTGLKGDGGDGGPGPDALLNGPHHLLMGPDGHLYIADTFNCRVRRVDLSTGRIHGFAGTGEKGFSGDGGPALQARLGGVYSLAFDPTGKHMYLVDLDNRRIRAVEMATGIVRTVAGNGKSGIPADGAIALEAPLSDPRAVAVDKAGNIYILERGGHALRVVDGAGRVRTVAGTGSSGFAGDGGAALGSAMNGPKHLAVRSDSTLLIVDTENHAILRYLPESAQVQRIAGTGKPGNTLGGDNPLLAQFKRPHGIYIHTSGDLYISDSDNNRVLRLGK